MLSRHDELDRFKTDINLVEFAESVGFQIDRKKSSRNNFILFNNCGEKLAITRRSNGHWAYLDVHSESGGTIVDFVQSRNRKSLGEVRKELRLWAGSPQYKPMGTQTQAMSVPPKLLDAGHVASQWEAAKPVLLQLPYLQERSIPYSVIANPIFRDRLRIDQRSNLLFPHWNLEGQLCGFEIKNKNFTGFATGGTKSLWCSRPRAEDQIAVFCETVIDALSFATLFGTERKRFFSTAGRLNSYQPLCIQSAVAKMPAGSQIWLAMDHDDAGQKLASQIRGIVIRPDVAIVEKLPEKNGDDWNDVLRREESQKHFVASPNCH